MQVGAGHREAEVSNARWCRRQWCPERSEKRQRNYKHGRHTKEVAATRRWLREAIDTLHELKKRL
jgi:hypothetical protein